MLNSLSLKTLSDICEHCILASSINYLDLLRLCPEGTGVNVLSLLLLTKACFVVKLVFFKLHRNEL